MVPTVAQVRLEHVTKTFGEGDDVVTANLRAFAAGRAAAAAVL